MTNTQNKNSETASAAEKQNLSQESANTDAQNELSPEEKDKKYASVIEYVNERTENASIGKEEIGEFIVTTFFDGDYALAKSRKPNKGLSLKELSQHEEILLSYSGLSRCVGLAVQEKEHSLSSMKHLKATHRIVLLSVKDDEKKGIAEKANKNKWSVARLKKEIEIHNGKTQHVTGNTVISKHDFKVTSGTIQKLTKEILISQDTEGKLLVEKVREWHKHLSKLLDEIEQIGQQIGSPGALIPGDKPGQKAAAAPEK